MPSVVCRLSSAVCRLPSVVCHLSPSLSRFGYDMAECLLSTLAGIR